MSVVDYLNSQKKDSSYASRAKLAQQQGISGYTGSAQQNSLMLSNLQKPQTKAVVKPKVGVQPKTVAKPKSIIPTKPSNTAQTYINQLTKSRQTEAMAGLNKGRDLSLSNLNQEKAEIQPRYYDARSQTSAVNQQQTRNFAEFMAARGGSNSGANAQAEISQQGAFQRNIGDLRQQEAGAIDDVSRRTTDVNNAYNSDVAGAKAGIEAQKMEALISQFNQDREVKAREDQFAYQKTRDQIADQKDKRAFDENVRQFGLGHAIQQAQLSLSRSKASSGGGSSSGGSKSSSGKSAKPAKPAKPLSTSDMKNYASLIESSSYYDKKTGTIKNEEGLKRYIADLNLPDSETAKLFSRYNLSTKEKAKFNPATMPRSLQPLFNGYGR